MINEYNLNFIQVFYFCRMNYLLIESATKYYGNKCLFENVNLGINKGQKIALIARNGTGKTSLLNTIAGIDTVDSGSVKLNKHITTGYLKQVPDYNPKATVLEWLFAQDTPVMKAIRAYELAISQEASDQEKDKIPELMQTMDRLHAWDQEARVKQVLSKLKISEFHHLMESLSGGQKKRVALAQLLITDPDFLILDEPTNHLDIEMIEWLEQYLQQPNLSLLLVTHDRYFLDRITHEIIELDEGDLYTYKGNYAYFLEKKADRLAADNTEVEKSRNLLRKEMEWMRRMPKARTTKSKARINSFYDLKETASKKVAQAPNSFSVMSGRLGSKILEMKSVSKSFGENTVLKGFTYSFKRGEKVGITGNNGTGKTTLLNLITGQLSPDTGTIKVGDTVEFGYFKQEDSQFANEKRIVDIIRDIAEVVIMANGNTITSAQFLRMFGYNNDMQYTQYGSLSGGERRRLHLLTVLMRNPNFLILDEPTNDLDLDTLQSLEDFLEHFQGCLLIVSHDRFFMDKLVDHLFVFKPNGTIQDFPGNYTQYRQEELKKQRNKPKSEAVEINSKTKEPKLKTKLSYKEGREFDQLSSDIEKLELRKKELTGFLQKGSDNYQDLMQWSDELEELMHDLDTKSERWLELSEFDR